MFPGEDVIELADIGDLKPEHVFDTMQVKCAHPHRTASSCSEAVADGS